MARDSIADAFSTSVRESTRRLGVGWSDEQEEETKAFVPRPRLSSVDIDVEIDARPSARIALSDSVPAFLATAPNPRSKSELARTTRKTHRHGDADAAEIERSPLFVYSRIVVVAAFAGFLIGTATLVVAERFGAPVDATGQIAQSWARVAALGHRR